MLIWSITFKPAQSEEQACDFNLCDSVVEKTDEPHRLLRCAAAHQRGWLLFPNRRETWGQLQGGGRVTALEIQPPLQKHRENNPQAHDWMEYSAVINQKH